MYRNIKEKYENILNAECDEQLKVEYRILDIIMSIDNVTECVMFDEIQEMESVLKDEIVSRFMSSKAS
jgi:chromatin segregation and condensation protein Rec8/ScpA/Scc1 (kleisin family)